MTNAAPATTVRRVAPGEGLRWRSLRLRALADTPVAFVDTVASAAGRSEAEWEERVAGMSAGCQQALFLAERGADWVGVAGGFASSDTTTTVFTVFVDPPARGQGVLEALVDAVASWSLQCGRHWLRLEVASEANPRAHAAYRRLGWQPTGASQQHPRYPDVVEIEMLRPAAPEGQEIRPT